MKKTNKKKGETQKTTWGENKALFISSFKELRKSTMLTMLLDLVFILLIIILFVVAKSIISYYVYNDVLPMGEQIAEMKAKYLQNIESFKNNESINTEEIPDFSKDIAPPPSRYKILLTIVITFMILVLFVSLFKTILWSFTKNTFKKFWKLFTLNVLLFSVWCILWAPIVMILKDSMLIGFSFFYWLIYLYLSVVLCSLFEANKPMFKQLIKQFIISLTKFWNFLTPITLIIMIGIIIFGINILLGYVLPEIITGIILLLSILFFISWSRNLFLISSKEIYLKS
jgi:hypothetical protein